MKKKSVPIKSDINALQISCLHVYANIQAIIAENIMAIVFLKLLIFIFLSNTLSTDFLHRIAAIIDEIVVANAIPLKPIMPEKITLSMIFIINATTLFTIAICILSNEYST